MSDHELVCVGGGLAGSALAIVMARAGHDVLVIEKETTFRDRVRGESLLPWGSHEAMKLGLYDLLVAHCALEIGAMTFWLAGAAGEPRDFVATTSYRAGGLDFRHQDMQEALLVAAAEAGATVRRGTTVSAVAPGRTPTVTVVEDNEPREITARLVVGADGRDSRVRSSLQFEMLRDPPYLFVSSVALKAQSGPGTSLHYFLDPKVPRSTFAVPLPDGHWRPYLMYRMEAIDRRLSGARDLRLFIEQCKQLGVPEEWFDGCQHAGPLATFDGAHRWVELPYYDGVVLVGDAASSSDPSWGNGLSMTLRDVRLLTDRLLADDDWHCAATAYAVEQPEHAARLRAGETMFRDLFFELGESGLQRRMRAFELMEKEPDRSVDFSGLGPDAPSDERTRRRLFGED